MNFLKQAPPQLKTDFKEDIVKVKIDRTLWRPSSLENIQRRSIIEESFYKIDQNQIAAFLTSVDNPKELIKEIFVPWRVHNLKLFQELCFRQQGRKGGFRWNREPIVYMKKLGINISSQFKHLQKLHLALDSYQEVNGKDLEEIGVLIGRNLINLTCLKLNFDFLHKIHIKHFQIFIQEVCKNLTNLKELRFYFDNPEGMTEEDLRSLTHDICRYLRKLEHFTFRCPSNGPKDDQVEKFLLDVGSSFPRLETLKLDFRWFSINFRQKMILLERLMEFGNKSINALNYVFVQHSTQLKSLSLNFSVFAGNRYRDSWLKEEEYVKIVENITTKLVDLQKIKLDLGGHLTNKGIKIISEQIFGSLSKLTHFGLCASHGGQKITNQGLKALGSSLKLKQNTLQQIKLDFWNCSEIDIQGFEILMGAIANHLSTLQVLELKFRYCTEIGSNSLRSLSSKVIKPCLKLKKLSLDFSNCRGIKGKGLEEFLIEIVNRQQSWESESSIGDFGKSEDKINELLASCPLIKWKINNY